MTKEPELLNMRELGVGMLDACETGDADRQTGVIGALMLLSVMPPEQATTVLADYPRAAAEILKGLNLPELDEIRVVLWNVATAAIAAGRVAP